MEDCGARRASAGLVPNYDRQHHPPQRSDPAWSDPDGRARRCRRCRRQGEVQRRTALRHFYASRCINQRADGGLELTPKVVQERLGHASIVMTLDTYSHLFPRGDDSRAEAEAEAALFAVADAASM